MKQFLLIAVAEWRFWLRSHLMIGGAGIFALLLIFTSVLTAVRMESESHLRTHQQQTAEATFLAQPDRHPHRMVHYGHYVFRNPTPLAIFDPGLDSVIGQSIFLEGHRQNSAMFAESGASADFGGFSWLTPALIYQLFAPLLLILIGHGAIAREREARTLGPLLAQGVNGYTIFLGKGLAIISFVLVLLVPMLFTGVSAIADGEPATSIMFLVVSYFIYLVMWAGLTLFVSATMFKRSNILATLTALWLSICLVIPSILVDIVNHQEPIKGKIETDLAMLVDVRKLGDGHNANDPAFVQLKQNLLEQYNVDRIEDLPVNFRGVVAKNSERKLTEVMNRYAIARMLGEARQADRLSSFTWVTPALAIANASRAISGTDLAHYHRFLNEAEELRFDFIQGLNEAHTEKLSYRDDINRNKDEASRLQARVDASNWEVLNAFVFKAASASERIARASNAVSILVAWSIAILVGLIWSARRLQP